jgi:hypothetical protein
MPKARMFPAVIVGVTVLLLFSMPSHGQFTFNVSGDSAFFYGYYSQMGRHGFFGPYNIDASAIGDYASLNGWVGNQDVGDLVSGTNAAQNNIQLQFEPSFRVGWAYVRGRYAINPYDTATANGTYVAISPGILTSWSLSANTPIARFAYGKRVFKRGFGLQFSQNRSLEYLVAERVFPVPDVIATLVGGGYLSSGAMRWLNPRRWFRYKMRKDNSGNDVGPDDTFFADEFKADPELKNRFRIEKDRRKRPIPYGLTEAEYGDPGYLPQEYEPEFSKCDSSQERCSKQFPWAGWKSAALTYGIGFFPWQQTPLPRWRPYYWQ